MRDVCPTHDQPKGETVSIREEFEKQWTDAYDGRGYAFSEVETAIAVAVAILSAYSKDEIKSLAQELSR